MNIQLEMPNSDGLVSTITEELIAELALKVYRQRFFLMQTTGDEYADPVSVMQTEVDDTDSLRFDVMFEDAYGMVSRCDGAFFLDHVTEDTSVSPKWANAVGYLETISGPHLVNGPTLREMVRITDPSGVRWFKKM